MVALGRKFLCLKKLDVLFCEFGTWPYADVPTTFSTAHFDKLSHSLIFLTFTQNI